MLCTNALRPCILLWAFYSYLIAQSCPHNFVFLKIQRLWKYLIQFSETDWSRHLQERSSRVWGRGGSGWDFTQTASPNWCLETGPVLRTQEVSWWHNSRARWVKQMRTWNQADKGPWQSCWQSWKIRKNWQMQAEWGTSWADVRWQIGNWCLCGCSLYVKGSNQADVGQVADCHRGTGVSHQEPVETLGHSQDALILKWGVREGRGRDRSWSTMNQHTHDFKSKLRSVSSTTVLLLLPPGCWAEAQWHNQRLLHDVIERPIITTFNAVQSLVHFYPEVPWMHHQLLLDCNH